MFHNKKHLEIFTFDNPHKNFRTAINFGALNSDVWDERSGTLDEINGGKLQ